VQQDDDASHRVAMYALPEHLGGEAAAQRDTGCETVGDWHRVDYVLV
jgi:hypothetical protein